MSELAAKLDAAIKKAQPKILTVDIERLPGLARVWDQKTRFVPISNFTRLPSLLCFSAKWLGSKQVEFYSAWDDAEQMVNRSWELYDEADAVITFNGRRFDNKHLRSEWLVSGMTPPSPWKDIDLYQIAASQYGFESKSLVHLCYRLGLESKAGRYDAVAAEKCLDGDPAAQKMMARYNKQDVRITEAAYLRMLGWIHNHPMLATPSSDDDALCNKCPDGGDLERRGTYLAQQIRYVRYQCRQCGGWVRGSRHSRASIVHGIK